MFLTEFGHVKYNNDTQVSIIEVYTATNYYIQRENFFKKSWKKCLLGTIGDVERKCKNI